MSTHGRRRRCTLTQTNVAAVAVHNKLVKHVARMFGAVLAVFRFGPQGKVVVVTGQADAQELRRWWLARPRRLVTFLLFAARVKGDSVLLVFYAAVLINSLSRDCCYSSVRRIWVRLRRTCGGRHHTRASLIEGGL